MGKEKSNVDPILQERQKKDGIYLDIDAGLEELDYVDDVVDDENLSEYEVDSDELDLDQPQSQSRQHVNVNSNVDQLPRMTDVMRLSGSGWQGEGGAKVCSSKPVPQSIGRPESGPVNKDMTEALMDDEIASLP